MIINKPKFWDTKNFLSSMLEPLSWIVKLLIIIKKKSTTSIKFNIPIICVGNIYIGGTGKTPLSIFLAKELKKIGKKPVIIKKFYKEHFDEQELIKYKFEDIILEKNRSEGINQAIKEGFDIVILDDGFQDYKIIKNLNILCFNSNQLIGNGKVIPAGPLREEFNEIKRANIIVINGEKNLNFEKKVFDVNKTANIFYLNYKPKNIDKFKNKKILAFAGIGNPSNFFELLKKYKLDVKKTISFPDHYFLNKRQLTEIISDAQKGNCEILTTEKDFFRIKDFKLNQINYLEVELELENKEEFLKKISEIHDKKF